MSVTNNEASPLHDDGEVGGSNDGASFPTHDSTSGANEETPGSSGGEGEGTPPGESEGVGKPKRSRRGRRGRGTGRAAKETPSEAAAPSAEGSEAGEGEAPAPVRRSRGGKGGSGGRGGRGGRGRSRPSAPAAESEVATQSVSDEAPATAVEGIEHDDRHDGDEGEAPAHRATKTAAPVGRMQMLISYVPGEETRIAVVESVGTQEHGGGGRRGRGSGGGGGGGGHQWRLEEYHAERAGHVSRVGNIYRGIVANVEQSIQAAFIDFGYDQHAFLHVTDIHPKYFPGEDDETTEMVGKKTPRRDRPPIQRCLRRGDEVLVQVLKDGVGTKGPTVTSYLSIPGRFLVMMPQMDRVGVSRKVEDEEMRREMRAILDQLELPEGFGFILRTAGMDRTKTELKRDLAYLQRLWKDMEAKRAAAQGNKPALLYSESDLLVRALRDLLIPEIEEVIIDHEAALKRASGFLKIVAPRAKTRLLQHTGKFPLFYSFGVEQQIAGIHAREVPLPSGGRLVIDETEALVAIDVNSGKSRDAGDAEMNAYKTNIEAVDEICRQLKLRDLGGIVINDLIDMRHASHRKDIEQRMFDRLKRDRARTTTLAISQFGILEMTRQRMRGSQETQNFSECPTCRGRGLVQRPESVSSDALRELLVLLAHERVSKVELVVAPRIAGELLSSRRRELARVERSSGKHIDVRVSETLPVDRVSFYVYDAHGADIELDKLPKARPPKELKVWDDAGDWAHDVEPVSSEPDVVDEPPPAQPHPIDMDLGLDVEGDNDDRPMRERIRDQARSPGQAQRDAVTRPAATPQGQRGGSGGDGGPIDGRDDRRRRRRRRRGRGGGGGGGGMHAEAGVHGSPPNGPDRFESDGAGGAGDQGGSDRGVSEPGGPRGNGAERASGAGINAPNLSDSQGGPDEAGGGRRRRRRRRRRGRGGSGGDAGGEGGTPLLASEGEGPNESVGAAPGAPQEPAFIDDSAPRGDSWDVEPNAVPRLDRPRAAPVRDAAVESDDESEGADDSRESNEAGADAGGNAGQEELGPDGEPRRRRRRRRRGRGGRGGGGGGEAPQGPQGQPGGEPRASNQGQRPDARGGDRGGGRGGNRGPRDRGPSRSSPPAPEPKPGASPGGGGGPGMPNFLYSSRRRLAPGEIPKQRRD